MIGLDTNVLLRYILQDDPLQSPLAASTIRARITTEQPGYVSLVTMAELVWVLSNTYGFSNERVVSIIRYILFSDALQVQNEREVFFALSLVEDRKGDFADALIASIGTWAGCSSTLTFDRKASRLPGFSLIEF